MKGTILSLLVFAILVACNNTEENNTATTENLEEFQFLSETFADLKILRYQIPDFKKLTLDQKKLVYFLSEAGKSGRDITYDQNYQHNIKIRKKLESIVTNYSGNREDPQWKLFMTYMKRFWFSNGIHHHYSNNKLIPEFSRDYLNKLLRFSGQLPSEEIIEIVFNPDIDNKKVNLDESKGLLTGSSINFYAPDITESEVHEFYSNRINKSTDRPISYGLNSKLVRDENGNIKEEVWKSGEMYGKAIDKIIFWLEKAVTVAENSNQKKGLELLIKYYQTGDLKTWDEYNIIWARTTEGDIDYINSFIEVYNDPLGYRGAYESIVQIKDFEASKRMEILSKNAQWFEDNSPISDEHKKSNVVGVSYKVVNVASETGDSSPSTPIGVNLPNANWIRKEYGSKSVSLGNIIHAYNKVGTKGFLEEFYHRDEEIAWTKEYGSLGDKMHTALHEVIGHASGQINEGVGTPKETLKNYASTIEEGRADLVALYFLLDPKLIELGLIQDLVVGKEQYSSYITNGLITQLRRIELGQNIEEAHMRNRAWISAWCFEKGKKNNVIEKIVKNGKTYFVVNDFNKLRHLFGELLKETQRIKSEGDFESAKMLVENYGVKIDPILHKEILERADKLNSAPYSGFINPELIPVKSDNGEIIDIRVEYPNDFTKQMLYYAKNYSFL
ncbi:dipeptidyl-peptidase 3 family protein [Reichenbachiella versicolor]|uniref:dipeptidyl-peptidase 3 family protein n=1 Tax=Reichenbachiella versicolor TaxID=1821036 RepID=UPI000D6E4567|nr:dihydrofolate reductase [Reichenbachiella versicolor]